MQHNHHNRQQNPGESPKPETGDTGGSDWEQISGPGIDAHEFQVFMSDLGAIELEIPAPGLGVAYDILFGAAAPYERPASGYWFFPDGKPEALQQLIENRFGRVPLVREVDPGY